MSDDQLDVYPLVDRRPPELVAPWNDDDDEDWRRVPADPRWGFGSPL